MPLEPINPESLARPQGFSHGMRGSGEWLLVAGQVGWNREGHIVSSDFVAQFDQALENVLEVVWKAGGGPESLARLTLYVLDKREYAASRKRLGEVYRARMGRHFPAMTLVEVKGLLEDGALVEIDAVALL